MNVLNLNKPFIFSILFGISSLFLFSQNTDNSFCDTKIDEEKVDYFNSYNTQMKEFEASFYSKSSKSPQLSKSSVKTLTNSIPVKAHIIRSSDGTGGLNPLDLNGIINNLNDVYSNAYLEFYLSGSINYIDNNDLCHLNRQNESALTQGNIVPNVINIYFIDYIENASKNSICGYANSIGKFDIVLIKNDCAKNGSSLAHEIGHIFSLMHTHGPDGKNQTTELVDGSNCDTDGDGICDTPADPKLNSKNVDRDCNYVGTLLDANNSSYTPDTGNIMSYSNKKCRSHFSKQQNARMFGFYKSAKNYYSADSFNADFIADITETCEDSLTVNFESTSQNATQWEWDIDGDNIIDYTTKAPSHTFKKGAYNISLTVSNKSRSISKTYFNYIKVGTLKDDLFVEDFETFTIANDQGWTVNQSYETGYSWRMNSGKTQTEGTGPVTDNTQKTSKGHYIYAEASGAVTGDVAEYISPCITISKGNLQLEFAYHMFGENMGQLHIDIQTDAGFQNDVIPVLNEQTQFDSAEDFLLKTVDLSEYNGQTIKVRFRAVRGKSWNSDIAIDDIKVIENPNKKLKKSNEITVKTYPNPLTGNTLYIQSNDLVGHTYYRVSNLVGQVFMEGVLTNNQINFSKLNKGSYFLVLQNGNSKVLKKIIK